MYIYAPKYSIFNAARKGIFTEFLNIIHETFLGLETAAEINVTFLWCTTYKVVHPFNKYVRKKSKIVWLFFTFSHFKKLSY